MPGSTGLSPSPRRCSWLSRASAGERRRSGWPPLFKPRTKPAASAELDRTGRPVFVLANQHRRWELNDLAGRLDSQPAAVELCEGLVPAPARSVSGLSQDGYRVLREIGELPEDSGRSSTWCGSTG